ncbi:phage late control D family protein [Arsenophonus nasoniae]|uniref:Phage late control D family protein n=1 Tax=Arsenophonus nasoniae TaxID=638 RepID=A0AA95GG21_9GAMM|nr:phage late control D family protein [Arsenophonus nasoniae]WGL95299.1 phage late control D family protein [Arsenophonus nasoniae]
MISEENSPAYALAAGSRNINALIQGRLISLTLTDNRGFEADQLDIELDDSDGQLALPRRGETLSLHLGWKNETLIHKGTFTVDEISYSGAPDKLTIHSRSADFRSNLNTRRELSYHQKKLGEIVRTIAKRNTLIPIVDNNLASITITHIDQTNESDGAFLTRLAQQEGAIATVKNGNLLFIRQGQAKTASGKSLPQMIITREIGDNYQFSLADRSAYTGVVANWLNTRQPQQKKPIKLKRQLKNNNKQGNYLIGEEGNILTLSHTYANKSNAARAAKSVWEKIQRGVANFSIQLAKGRAELYPEMPVKTFGFKPEIDIADWIITRVTHTLNDNGFITALELEVKISELEMQD